MHTVCTVNWMSVCVSLSLSFCLFFGLFSFSPDLGQSIFYTTTCLLPFLSDDILSTLPYTMISTLATFPPFLHKDIIEYLSTSFLPMAICEYDKTIHASSCQAVVSYTTTLILFQRRIEIPKRFLCSGLHPQGRRSPCLHQSVCFLYAYDCDAVHLKSR